MESQKENKVRSSSKLSNRPFATVGLDIIGVVKVKLLHKPYTNHYKVAVDGLKSEETEVIKSWQEADKIYQKVGSALRKQIYLKLKDII